MRVGELTAKQRALVWEALDPLFAKGVDMIVAQVYQIGNVEAPTTVEVVQMNCLCQIGFHGKIDTYLVRIFRR